ncbi:F-box only protein 42 [Mortierella sp. AD094]|nr:F-box only protein 42 [Mortierella sp. AD094]
MATPQLTVAGAAVSPTWRAFHGAAIVDTSMLIFGGITDPTKSPYGYSVQGSNDLWVWSTTLRQWSQPSIQFPGSSTSAPAPQKCLSSITLQSQGKMMSYIGNVSSPTNSLLMLDTYFWVWSIPNSPNAVVAPPLRLGAAVGTSDSLVFVHGGAAVGANGYATTGVLNDLTKLDESTFQWTSIANGPSLMYHTMCRLTGLNMMAIFGGSDQTTSAYNTVNTFDLTLEVWRLAVPVNPGVGGTVPSARKGHTAVCLNNTMIVYGGGPDGPLDDDVWVLDASKTQWVWNRITTNKQMGPGPRTGHSALLNGTNMLVWGGYGAPMPNDTNIYILDTVAWQWSSSKESASPAIPVSIPSPPGGGGGTGSKKNNLPLTIGVICGSLALIAAFIGFLLLRRRSAKRDQGTSKDSQTSASFLSDVEQHGGKDIILEEKPSSGDRESTSSTGKRSQNTAMRRSPQGYPMQSMAAFAEQGSSQAESSRSSGRNQNPQALPSKDKEPTTTSGSVGARVGSIASDPYYPTYLAEDDEEDADRWTFASSLSFDQRDNNHSLPTLRYIPTRVHGTTGTQRTLSHSTGSIGGSSSQRIPIMVHPHGGSRRSRATRRDASGMSVRTGNGSSIGPGSATAASTELLNRDGATSPRDATIFNSVSPLDRVTLLCSGMDVGRSNEDDALLMNYRNSGSAQLLQQNANTRDQQQAGTVGETRQTDLRRKDTTSTSTTKSSTTYTTLDNPALVTLVQNLPARYKLSKSPSPIHGETNDILFAIDSDTQQPIVIKSFARKEAWERECRILKRLRGPYIVELKHVATLVLSETDDPNKPAKVRLTILERLDETLAQMLKNARKAKKVALREQAQPNETLDLAGAGLYRSGPALDEGYIRDIAKGILRCLTWCHSKKIVYCDLKPSNVMHNRDDPRQKWKLIDLESSRVASEECIGIGTVRYCPPEVAKGTTVEKQASSGVTANYSIDLWAFGCLIYELFATRPLFPLTLSDDTVLHFLAHPSPGTPSLANGLRWNSTRELGIPDFEEAVPNKDARVLIRTLLHPDPHLRATINHVLDSEYLRISPELKASFIRASSSNEIHQSESPETELLLQQQQSQQQQAQIESNVDPILRVNPCLLMPLPVIANNSSVTTSYTVSSPWLDPSNWNSSSFGLHYLCQHYDTSLSSFGHFVQQPGCDIQDPLSLFRDIRPLLLKSLDLQIADPDQCPPGYESLSEFKYDVEKDQVPFTTEAADPRVTTGFVAYRRWIRRRIFDLASSPSTPSSSENKNDDNKDILASLDRLRAFSDAAKPNLDSVGMHLISRGDTKGAGGDSGPAEKWICGSHINLPEYKDWIR